MKKGFSIPDHMDLGRAQCAGSSSVRDTEQDRHFANQRTRFVENRNLDVPAKHLDATLREYVNASRFLALSQEDRPSSHMLQRNVAAVIKDGTHQPAFTFLLSNVIVKSGH